MKTFARILSVFVLSIPLCHADLLTNGNFNTPDNQWWAASGWDGWGCSRSNCADRAGNGRGAMAPDCTTTDTAGFYQDVPVTLGLTYTFSIWARKDAGYPDKNTEIKIEWMDANKVILSSLITNITGHVGPTYAKFKISGSTENSHCKYIRVVATMAWSNIVPHATMQFDDAYLEAEPGTVIEISETRPNPFYPALLLVPLAGLCAGNLPRAK